MEFFSVINLCAILIIMDVVMIGNNIKYVTGIGSRECPKEMYKTIYEYCKILIEQDYILRSGGANGADLYFETAYDYLGGRKEIYLPWKGFNYNQSLLFNLTKEAFDLAKKFHPRYDQINQAAKKLMARNGYQVLGYELNSPTDLIVCWTKDGKDSGGTGQAIRIARHNNIPVFNLYNLDDCIKLSLKLSK